MLRALLASVAAALVPAGLASAQGIEFRAATGPAWRPHAWTNAQVAALAGTSGNLTMTTLPARTVVLGAYVVLDGQAAGPTTVTVSCGRTASGYTDYLAASSAKAAAGTVFGDASGERGANLTGYDLPSYSTTTAVVCQFVSTGANLSTVTGSAGRLLLLTDRAP